VLLFHYLMFLLFKVQLISRVDSSTIRERRSL